MQLTELSALNSEMKTPANGARAASIKIRDARRIRNLRLTCDWCGEVPPLLYLPCAHSGVFCRKCVTDVLNRSGIPPKRVCIRDGEEVDGFVEVGRKLDAFLKRYPRQPIFCGREPGRPRRNPAPSEDLTPPQSRVKEERQHWRYFNRTDFVRIVSGDAKFRGVRATVWGFLSNSSGITVAELLTRAKDAGLPETQAAAILRKLLVVYRVCGYRTNCCLIRIMASFLHNCLAM